MSTTLTGQNGSNIKESVPLTRVQSQPFKLCFQKSLDGQFNFKRMKQNGIKDLHDFIENTIGKNLSISDVDKLYLRKRGLSLSDEVHYGKDRHPFRLYGRFIEGHFVVSKIVCNHKANN